MADDIIKIPIEHLYPHPDNPRRDVGDVTELAESIKSQGILQNLTVIRGHYQCMDDYVADARAEGMTKDAARTMYMQMPHDDRWSSSDYTVLIGHRRLAAARQAGLTELPCTIVEMSHEDQIATMLSENMQRSDLTLLEEAGGIQMMFNLGADFKSIAGKTGLSETTVRRRKKIADMDRRKVAKGIERGATIEDFIKLDSIEDEDEKDKLLEVIGTADFQNEFRRAKNRQADREYIQKCEDEIRKWAVRADEVINGFGKWKVVLGGKEIVCVYSHQYDTWSKNKEVTAPEDSGKMRYYYHIRNTTISIYRKWTKADDDEQAERDAARKQVEDELDSKKAKLREITERHRSLRRDFIKNFDAYTRDNAAVMEFLADAMLEIRFKGQYNSTAERDAIMPGLAEFLGITYSTESHELNYSEYLQLKMSQPLRTAVLEAYFWLDEGSFWKDTWNVDKRRYVLVWKENKELEKLIKSLELMGYRESLEEVQMRRGSHKLFEEDDE